MHAMSFVALSTALLMSTAAAAETKTAAVAMQTRGPTEATQKTESKAAPAPRKICKRLATTGSRMEERVCLTKDEWKLVEKEVEE